MSDLEFLSIDLSQVDGWFDATSRGELVTPAQRLAAAVWAGTVCDVLCNPVAALGAVDGAVRLPMVPYRGTDRELVARRVEVPVVGAVPPPAHWRTGAAAPAELPAWVRATDAERRQLYGATRVFLERLAATGTPNPQQGAAGSGWLPAAAIVAVAVVGYVYVGSRVVDRVGDVVVTRVREDAATARYGALLRAKIEAAKTRYEEGRRTGTVPAPLPIEGEAMASPYNPTTGRTPAQEGDGWWTKAGAALPWVLGGTALVTAVIGGGAWLWSRKGSQEFNGGAGQWME